MNVLLWVLQVALAGLYLAGGAYKTFSFDELAHQGATAVSPEWLSPNLQSLHPEGDRPPDLPDSRHVAPGTAAVTIFEILNLLCRYRFREVPCSSGRSSITSSLSLLT